MRVTGRASWLQPAPGPAAIGCQAIHGTEKKKNHRSPGLILKRPAASLGGGAQTALYDGCGCGSASRLRGVSPTLNQTHWSLHRPRSHVCPCLAPSKPGSLHGCEAVQTTAWGEMGWCQLTFRSSLNKQGFRHAQCSDPSHLIFNAGKLQIVMTAVRQDWRKTVETVTPSCWYSLLAPSPELALVIVANLAWLEAVLRFLLNHFASCCYLCSQVMHRKFKKSAISAQL